MKKTSSGISKHHRRPKKQGGSNDKSNISYVSKHKHRAWHNLFNHMTPHEIAEEINDRWLDPDYVLIVRKRS